MNQKDNDIAAAIANFIINGVPRSTWGNEPKSLVKQFAKQYLPTMDGKYTLRGPHQEQGPIHQWAPSKPVLDLRPRNPTRSPRNTPGH